MDAAHGLGPAPRLVCPPRARRLRSHARSPGERAGRGGPGSRRRHPRLDLQRPAAPPDLAAARARPSRGPRRLTPRPKISGYTRVEAVPGLRFRVPVEWRRVPESTPQDRPTFIIPGPGGEAALAIYHFAHDPPRARDAYQQWRQQFTQADGTPSLGADRLQAMVRGPLQVTLVDLPGEAGQRVLPDPPHRYPGPDDRTLGVIVDGTEDDPRYFFAAVGPAPTLAYWEQAFADFATTIAVDFPP